MNRFVTASILLAVSLPALGLSAHPELAQPITSAVTTCACTGTLVAPCFYGTHYSNGLSGIYDRRYDNYNVPDAWNDCPTMAER